MLDKLKAIEARFTEVGEELNSPAVMSDMKRYASLNKEYKDLNKIVTEYHRYQRLSSELTGAREILVTEKDEELREMAKEEITNLEPRVTEAEENLKNLLIPSDPEDSKNVVLEIRAGTGGDEASLFAGELFRMYQRYCETRRWKIEVSESQEGTMGGYKEIVATIIGEDAYGTLKYESGVHRVQRVPQTETMGRVHTSAATVVMMPEMEDFEVDLKDNDIKMETFCSSGPGGQSVNTTYSAVRLTHIPTGVVVSMQDEKSQIKNKEKAMRNLKIRVYDLELRKRMEEQASKRKTIVSTGDRSAKIRTYNFPQSRVTDHRIGLTIYNLTSFINGNIQEMLDALRIAENAEKLKAGV